MTSFMLNFLWWYDDRIGKKHVLYEIWSDWHETWIMTEFGWQVVRHDKSFFFFWGILTLWFYSMKFKSFIFTCSTSVNIQTRSSKLGWSTIIEKNPWWRTNIYLSIIYYVFDEKFAFEKTSRTTLKLLSIEIVRISDVLNISRSSHVL